MNLFFTKCYFGDKIKRVAMVVTYSTYGREEKCV